MNALNHKNKATLVGCVALILWAVEPLVVSELEGFPIFESLTLVFVSCFLLTAIRLTFQKRWHEVFSQSLFVWLFGTATICGSDFAYIFGAYMAPIAHVDLIDYLWPCMIVALIGFLPGEKFSFRHLLGAVLGLYGVYQLLCGGQGLSGFNMEYAYGYALAFYGVILWGTYSIYSRFSGKNTPPDMVGAYCGVAAIITFTLHLSLEETVMPTVSQGGLAVMLGLAGPGLAYQLWDHGVKFGDAKWLSASCYFARVAALALLVYFGKEPFSVELVIACVLACVGVFISSLTDSAWLRFVVRPLGAPFKLLKVAKSDIQDELTLPTS